MRGGKVSNSPAKNEKTKEKELPSQSGGKHISNWGVFGKKEGDQLRDF